VRQLPGSRWHSAFERADVVEAADLVLVKAASADELRVGDVLV